MTKNQAREYNTYDYLNGNFTFQGFWDNLIHFSKEIPKREVKIDDNTTKIIPKKYAHFAFTEDDLVNGDYLQMVKDGITRPVNA